ncbi:MAG: AMP-binding protein [Bacteroidetes bacterium]|nr:AMP-binding protein [Bacteroidota bacterium]
MSQNFGAYILDSIRRQSDSVLLAGKDSDDHPKYWTGAELEAEIRIRVQSIKRKPTQALILIPFGEEHLVWVLAMMIRGVSVIYLPKKGLFWRLLFGKRLTMVVPKKGKSLQGFILQMLGHRVMRLNPSAAKYQEDERAGQPALISHSSGTGGKPKTIRRSHEVLMRQHEALKKAFPPFDGQIDYPLFPNVLLHNLACGIKTVLPDLNWSDWTEFFPGHLLDQMEKEQVSTLTGNLFYFLKLVGTALSREYTLNHVKAVGIGGSTIPDWLLDDMQKVFPKAQIFVIYGSTEAEPITLREFKRHRNPMHGYCVGKPHPDIELRIQKIGEIEQHDATQDWGEITVSGPHVISKNNAPLQTGDLGYLFEDELYLIGRKENIGDYMGIYSYQIEHYLRDQTDLEDVAVIIENEVIRIFYVSDENEDGEIHAAIKNALGEVPCVSKRLFELPKDDRHHSKTIYKKLYADHISRN